MSVLLQLRSYSVGYGRSPVLRDVDLEVRAGELWFLVGPNGVGKTTLLRTVLGQLRPLGGEARLAPELAGRRRLGFVSQRMEFDRALPTTVREFVLLGTTGLGLRRGERLVRLQRALDLVGLDGRDRSDYWSLSGGQRQRALIARALVREPLLIVADEPTAGLDLAASETLLASLASLVESTGAAVIIVTHDLDKAVRHGSRFALCADGTVVAGDASAVLRAGSLERAYGVPAEVREDEDGRRRLRVGRREG